MNSAAKPAAGTASVPLATDSKLTDDAGRMPAVPARILSLPENLRAHLIAEARAAAPRECCGLIEGVYRGETVEAIKLHPLRNLADAPDRFEIDPSEQFRLLKDLRGTERDIVGCYHSHPNGVAQPSERDREGAGEEGFVWLIVGLSATDAAVSAHLFAEGEFCPLRFD